MDRTSDGAMAAHAYKQSVGELDDVIGRELVNIRFFNLTSPRLRLFDQSIHFSL